MKFIHSKPNDLLCVDKQSEFITELSFCSTRFYRNFPQISHRAVNKIQDMTQKGMEFFETDQSKFDR